MKMMLKIIKQFTRNNHLTYTAVNLIFQKRCSSSSSTKYVEGRIVRSKCPDIRIPDLLLDEYVFKDLDKWADQVAMQCAVTGRSYTYIELYKKSRCLANFFHKCTTLKKGDTVAIVLPNVPEYPIVILGAAQAALKITTVNPTYTSNEIQRQLKDSNTKMIFTIPELWPKVDTAMRSIPDQTIDLVTIEHEEDDYVPSIKFKDITEGDHNLAFKIERSMEDVLMLPYSSGTTGLPKGVELTNKNITAVVAQMSAPELSYMLKQNDVSPAVLPFFHIYGMTTVMLNLLIHGCKMVTMPKFDPQLFVDVLDKHQPKFAFLVPPLILFMSNHPSVRPDHISKLRIIYSGAAPLGAADIARLRKKSKSEINILQGYGLTETSPGVCGQTELLPNGIKPGGSGLCLRNTEIKIVSLDDAATLLGPNQSGELYVRGPQVMKGYYNNPKATAEVLDQDGWFRTGDIAHYDDDEHFFITDRLKELIKVKGFQVAPAELEEILRDHPDIEDAAVAGVAHQAFGEVPKAFIVSKKGVQVNPDKVAEYVASKVSKHKQLVGGVVVVDSIPKTVSGKILRKELK